MIHKQAEVIQKLSHSTMIKAMEIAHMGCWEWNIKDNSEMWSDEQFRIFGYEPGEITPTYDHFVGALHPDDRDRVLAAVNSALHSTEPYNIEFRIIRPDRTERTVFAQGEVNRDDHNNPVRMVGTVFDITEHRKTEKELINSQKDLQKLTGRLIMNQEEELRYLARELHDNLTQQLAVMAIDAGNIEQQKDVPESVLQKVSHIKEQLIKTSKEVHNLSRDLHPSILEDLGLERAVRSECNNFSSRMGIAVVFTPKNIPAAISNDIALSIYRIIQEGLANIAKYAQTKNAYVFLEGFDSSIQLSIRDTRVGFDPTEVRHKAALGLGSMRERVRLVNGKFSITSKPGKGTSIEVEIPLKENVEYRMTNNES